MIDIASCEVEDRPLTPEEQEKNAAAIERSRLDSIQGAHRLQPSTNSPQPMAASGGFADCSERIG